MQEDSLHFAYPIVLAIGLAVCALFVVLFIRFDRRRDAAIAKIIHPRFRQRLTEGFSPFRRNLKRALWLLAILLAFLAAARPQKGYEWREVKRRGIDILFAIDTSRSMLAQDLTPNRLERSRLGITDFVDRLEGDRVGLIPFAGSAFALCPLTLDYGAFRESLDAIDTELIPRQGTDLASAIREAERLFDEEGNNHRILVLITDGEDLQGDVIDAAKDAAENGTIIHTVGVGNPEGSPIPIRDRWGRTGYVRDQQGQIVHTKLDESTLKKIAEATGGLYVPLGRGAEGLHTIYQEKLSLVPKHELKQRMERIPIDRFLWPLAASVALLAIHFFLSDRRRPKQQRALPSAARRKAIHTALTLAALGLTQSDTRAEASPPTPSDPRLTYNKGTEAYQSGDFETAANTLRDALKTPDLSLQQKAYYNLGNTLYRTGQTTLEKDPHATIKSWEASIKAFEDALALNAADSDAEYNRDFVKRKLEELQQQQNQQQNQNPQNQDQQEDQKQEDQKNQDEQQQNQDQSQDSQQNQDQQNQNQQNQDQQEQSQNQQDQQNQNEKNQQNSAGEDEREQESQQPQHSGDQESEDQQQQNADPQENDSENEQGDGQTSEMTERKAPEEMTPEQAKQLLDSLRDDERTVIPIQPIRPSRRLTPDNSTKGKTW